MPLPCRAVPMLCRAHAVGKQAHGPTQVNAGRQKLSTGLAAHQRATGQRVSPQDRAERKHRPVSRPAASDHIQPNRNDQYARPAAKYLAAAAAYSQSITCDRTAHGVRHTSSLQIPQIMQMSYRDHVTTQVARRTQAITGEPVCAGGAREPSGGPGTHSVGEACGVACTRATQPARTPSSAVQVGGKSMSCSAASAKAQLKARCCAASPCAVPSACAASAALAGSSSSSACWCEASCGVAAAAALVNSAASACSPCWAASP